MADTTFDFDRLTSETGGNGGESFGDEVEGFGFGGRPYNRQSLGVHGHTISTGWLKIQPFGSACGKNLCKARHK